METNIELGLELLLVGMTTVFFILFFVVAGGNILIRIANRFFAVENVIPSDSAVISDKKKMAAIIAAVEVVTAGKGKVSSIKKSDN